MAANIESTIGPPLSFLLPIDISRLENERMRLIPFETNFEEFAKSHVEETKNHADLFTYSTYGPFQTLGDFENWYSGRVGDNTAEIMFAIMLKAGIVRKRKPDGSFDEFKVEDKTYAGMVALHDAVPAHSEVEIGHVCIIPRFQRTFVATHANGLLLRHLLNPLPQDLNMRRVVWQANYLNKASIGAAERLGFKIEGIRRWHKVIPENKEAGLRQDGMPREDKAGSKLGPGRHSIILSLCWDDWLDGGKQKINELMNL